MPRTVLNVGWFLVGCEAGMVHGYHLILPMYGFWLPNDPRRSWSDYVRNWEIARFGKATRTAERKLICELSAEQKQLRLAAKKELKFPAVSLTGMQAASVGRGFKLKIELSNYTIWACAILPEHTHFVVARHTYEIEKVANQLKGAATRQLKDENLHPLAGFQRPDGKTPPMWASRQWKVYLDSEVAIEEAIHYVEMNPVKEDKPPQHWKFVSPFEGIPKGGWTTY